MKKLFFTAIAMIAFSSTSMANTIADEEIVLKDEKVLEDCTDWAVAEINAYEAEFGCVSASQYGVLLNQYISHCNNH